MISILILMVVVILGATDSAVCDVGWGLHRSGTVPAKTYT